VPLAERAAQQPRATTVKEFFQRRREAKREYNIIMWGDWKSVLKENMEEPTLAMLNQVQQVAAIFWLYARPAELINNPDFPESEPLKGIYAISDRIKGVHSKVTLGGRPMTTVEFHLIEDKMAIFEERPSASVFEADNVLWLQHDKARHHHHQEKTDPPTQAMPSGCNPLSPNTSPPTLSESANNSNNNDTIINNYKNNDNNHKDITQQPPQTSSPLGKALSPTKPSKIVNTHTKSSTNTTSASTRPTPTYAAATKSPPPKRNEDITVLRPRSQTPGRSSTWAFSKTPKRDGPKITAQTAVGGGVQAGTPPDCVMRDAVTPQPT